MYTFNHAFFSGRPLSHSFPLCFLLMGIGFSFLVCTIWPFLVSNDYLLWEYYYVFYFGIHTIWPFLMRNNDRVRQAKLISSFFPSIISHGEIFFRWNYIIDPWSLHCVHNWSLKFEASTISLLSFKIELYWSFY